MNFIEKLLNLFGMSRKPMTDKEYYNLGKTYRSRKTNQ